jgi:signal transduction histidine kinase
MTTININIDFETLSHELRTPLVGILGMTEIMAGENVSSDIREKVDVIHNACDRLMIMVNKILTHTDTKSHIRN